MKIDLYYVHLLGFGAPAMLLSLPFKPALNIYHLLTISLICVSCDTAKLGEADFCTFIVLFFALVLWGCCSSADEFRAVSQPTKCQS